MQAGRVGRPHGLDGSFHVTRALAGAFDAGTVLLRGQPAAIDRLAGTAGRPIVRLAGHSSREAAESLRGEPLMVPASQVALEEDEFWEKDLVGCEIEGLGTVTALVELPSCEALQVGSLLVPLVRDAIVSIDLEARRIVVNREFLGAD